MVPVIDFFLSALLVYSICGFISSVFLLFFRTSAIDPALGNSKKKIKLLLIPGVLATWPYFAGIAINKKKSIKNNTNKLKRTQLLIWVFIICSLPGMLIFATDGLIYPDKNTATTQKSSNIERDSYTAENEFMRIHKASGLIRIDIKKPLKSASSLVYSCDQKGNRIKFLGQIQNQNLYEFKIQEDIQGILIYDGIKNKTITKLLLP